WEETLINRDTLPQATKNSLGSTLTVFRLDEWGSEIENRLDYPNTGLETENEGEEESEVVEDLKGRASVMVQDKIDELDTWQMDYNADARPTGADGGIAVLAYKDALGFEEPIIKVQVKHRKSTAGAREVRELIGSNPSNANNLFVSTGGFTRTAVQEAEHKSVKLIDLEELVELIVTYYEGMPNDTKSLILLQKIYVPESM